MKKTKASLVEDVAQKLLKSKSTISTKTIAVVIDVFIQSAKEALTKGSSIELRGFGTFELRQRKIKHNARNPRTGSSVYVPSHTVVAFKSGKDLRNAVWNLNENEEASS